MFYNFFSFIERTISHKKKRRKGRAVLSRFSKRTVDGESTVETIKQTSPWSSGTESIVSVSGLEPLQRRVDASDYAYKKGGTASTTRPL